MRPESKVQSPKASASSALSLSKGSKAGGAKGFTLIEIMMVVVMIMGLVMTMSVPMVYRLWHKAPMIKAIRDVSEVLSRARVLAVLRGTVAEVVFHPRDKRLEVSAGAAAPRPAASRDSADPAPAAPPQSGLSAQLDPSIIIEMLDVNLTEYKDADVARVRFYPNGTCDELTLILHSDGSGGFKSEWYKITLEITTSLATVGPVDR